MKANLPLLFQAAYFEPLALEPSHFAALHAYLWPRLTGQAADGTLDLSAAMPGDKPNKRGHYRASLAMPTYGPSGEIDPRYYFTLEGRPEVAVVPWQGIMAKGAGFLQEACMGMVSHDRISHAIRQALEEPDVKTIILDVNSPGGQVTGTPELAALVTQAAKKKKVLAFTDGTAASAAVWGMIGAREIYATPSARIGSIGTILALLDESVRFQAEGLKPEVFSAGKHKPLGVRGRPMTDDDRAYLQSIVDEANALFVGAVQKARPSVKAEVLTDAKTYSAKQAAALGLIDGIVGSWEEFVSLV